MQASNGSIERNARDCMTPPSMTVSTNAATFDGRLVLVEGRLDDVRAEQVLVRFEDRQEDVVLALEEVIEAAAVRAGTLEEFGEPGRRVALFPEESAGDFHDPLPGCRRLSYLNDQLNQAPTTCQPRRNFRTASRIPAQP
jgi:hypothetical protein